MPNKKEKNDKQIGVAQEQLQSETPDRANQENSDLQAFVTSNNTSVNNGDEEVKAIVCIGGSAGSVEPIEKFFKNMPNNSGIAFVIIQHLDPTQKGLMPFLLTKWTSMSVLEVIDGTKINPDHVYIIPPNKEMSIINGTLLLFEPSKPRGYRMPIDVFMESLAKDQGAKAVGIILSGFDSDGVQGAKFIKESFGMVMVQSPASSQVESMPLNTIQRDFVDFIALPEELPHKLLTYVHKSVKLKIPQGASTEFSKYNITLHKIFILLRNQTGHDFSLYKKNTIYRRVERRMNTYQITNIEEYLSFMQQNPSEVHVLFKELLIGVTKFFRDAEAFNILKRDLFPSIIKNNNGRQIRIWAPGVSTGEEIYSLAIVAIECMEEMSLQSRLPIQLFATDIDQDAIERARSGIFLGNIAADMSLERLERFFVKDGSKYQIKKEVREIIVFAPHNLIKDAPFTKMDLICCRNVMIYFSQELQKKLIPIFHYSLNPEGYLFLGPSEGLGSYTEMFKNVSPKWKIFQRKTGEFMKINFPISFSASNISHKVSKPLAVHLEAKSTSLADLAHKILLLEYTPSGAIINQNGDILYVHGRTGRFLEPASGNANMNILNMAREGLKFELTSGLLKAVSHKSNVTLKKIRVKTNGHYEIVNIIIRYIHEPVSAKGLLMVIFEDPEEADKEGKVTIQWDKETKRDSILTHLEKELAHTKQQLQTTSEEMESSLEELKSTNEELQSTNEELQSINEESISSKEEMQSLNEELMAINVEYQSKTDELTQVNNDMKNLLDSTEIATVIVDNKLNIKRYTATATKIFNIIPTDQGRPLMDIAPNLKYKEIIKDAKEVLERLSSKEIVVETESGEWYNMRISPYRTLSNYIDGVVITFSEITKMKDKLHEALFLAEAIVNAVRDPLVIMDKELTVIAVSRSFGNLFKVDQEKIKGQHLYHIGAGEWDVKILRDLLFSVISDGTEFNDYELELTFPGLGIKKLLLNARRMQNKQVNKEFILMAIEDISNK